MLPSTSAVGAICLQHPSKKGISKRFNIIRDYTGLPPISMLHDDLLWHIFTFNTLEDDDIIYDYSADSSLIDTRHTSQVCASWRALILASSSLWANVINLEHLNQKSDDWRNEILRRTDHSFLSVKGNLKEGTPATAFCLFLLSNHWTRIRRLFIKVEDEVITGDERLLSIQRPAPNLEIFHVKFRSCPTFSTTHDILFSNDAPFIHTLITVSLDFNLSGPWLSRVRRLHLSKCSV